MPSPDLPALERDLEARLLELEGLHQARPRMPDALARADAGRQIDELLDEIGGLQREIMLSPATTLQDAAVKVRQLRRLPATRPGACEARNSLPQNSAQG